MNDLHTELEQLASDVAGLLPDWKSAEQFYEKRSDIRARLKALARSPAAIRIVTRFVRLPADPPTPPPAPPPALKQPRSVRVRKARPPDGQGELLLSERNANG